MPFCCLGIVAVMFPRLALVVMALTGYGARAFETVLWPVVGFLFMPYTTCAYAIAMNEFGGVQGWGLALMILGVILDLGSHGGGARSSSRYRHRRSA
jgi:hypothetical protein